MAKAKAKAKMVEAKIVEAKAKTAKAKERAAVANGADYRRIVDRRAIAIVCKVIVRICKDL